MASGTGKETAPQDTECSHCRQPFRDPTLLPCCHVLCRHCLLQRLASPPEQQQEQQEDWAAPGCPLCGEPIADPLSGSSRKEGRRRSWEEVVQDLPTDLSTEALVRAAGLLGQDHECRVCEGVGATSLCLTCGDVLCGACQRAHGKLSALRHHRVQELSGLTPESLVVGRVWNCPSHPEETPQFFCPEHGRAVCLRCLASAMHKDCGEVEDLEEKMEEAQDRLASLEVTVTSGVADLQAAVGQLDRHLEQTGQEVKAALARVEDVHDRLESSLRESRLRLKEQLTQALRDVSEAVTEGKGCLERKLAKLTSHRHAVRRLRGLKNYDDLHVMLPVIEKRAHDLDYSVILPIKAKPISTFSFSVDSEAVAEVEKVLCGLAEVELLSADIFADHLPELRFHEHCGTAVTLKSEGQTAVKVKDSRSDQGIVLSRDPLHLDFLYEVRIDRWEDTYEQGSMCVGVVSDHCPLSLPLPSWSGDLKSSAVVIRKNWIKNCLTGSQVSGNYGWMLGTLRAGSRVGVALDSWRCLHLYVDGQDQGVAARDLPRPCFALFDLCDAAKMVTALPVTKLPDRQTASIPNLLSIPGRETTM